MIGININVINKEAGGLGMVNTVTHHRNNVYDFQASVTVQRKDQPSHFPLGEQLGKQLGEQGKHVRVLPAGGKTHI